MEKMLSRSEAAKELGIWPKTLMSWVRDRKLNVTRNQYNHALFNKEEVLKLKNDIENSKPPVGFKDCSKCKERKSLEYFNSAGSICKICYSVINKIRRPPELNRKLNKEYRERNPHIAKKYNFMLQCRKYNLTPEELNTLKEKSKNRCEICGSVSDKLCVDHNHETGKVRGLLCHACNLAIGNLRDNINNFKNAISYLESHSKPQTPSVYKQLVSNGDGLKERLFSGY